VDNAARRLTHARGLFDSVAEQLDSMQYEEQVKLQAQQSQLPAEAQTIGNGTLHRDDSARVSGVALGDRHGAWGGLHRANQICKFEYDAIIVQAMR
jgi:hypothetical protein